MEIPKSFWTVYVLKLSNNKYYVGFTSHLGGRLQEHKKGSVNSTKIYRPFELVSWFNFTDKYVALKFEKYLKSGSGHAFRNKRLL